MSDSSSALISFYVELFNTSLTSSLLLAQYQLAVQNGTFLTILHSQNKLNLNNINTTSILNSNDFTSSNINDDTDDNIVIPSDVSNDDVMDMSTDIIVVAIIPGLLIVLIGCMVEFLRQFYKEHICLPDDSPTINIGNIFMKGIFICYRLHSIA